MAMRKGRKNKYHYCSKACRDSNPWNKNQKMSSEFCLKMSKVSKGRVLEKSNSWRGGRYIRKDGYVNVHIPDHPMATINGWVFEHIVVACKKLGRTLNTNEVVHHIDGDKTNNDPENLEIIKRSEHTRKHMGNPTHQQEGEKNFYIDCFCGCGEKLLKYDNRGRPRKYRHGHQRRK